MIKKWSKEVLRKAEYMKMALQKAKQPEKVRILE
jgi:hypothetical protein